MSDTPTERTHVQGHTPAHLFADLPAVSGYAVTRELGRGGMGTVYAAHDPAFDRPVAIKVMHPGLDADRFVVESKVTAQLPHPGVPPVYALGRLGDGRPFLAMKLVEGRTLAAELRAATDADVPRLLGAFEAICQTVGFAHSRGIVHRDLKPANVMLGAFGEVLVMDWGLAKRAGEAGAVGTAPAPRPPAPPGATAPGAIKGTPSYMAPEQARGEVVDARADVFALGGVLATVLTGNPPFVADSVMGTVLQAAEADLAECFAELDECGADAELVALAKRCLAARPGDRYVNGAEVAAAVAAYRAGVEERLRAAERDRAARAAEAREQKKRRRVQLALAGAVALLVSGGGAFAWWRDRQAIERGAELRVTEARLGGERDKERELRAEQARDGIDRGLALATALRRQYKFKEADAALLQALHLAEGGAPERVAEVAGARADLALVVRLDDVRFRKWAFVTDGIGTGRFDTRRAPPEYRAALAAGGLDLIALDPAEAAGRIADAAIRAELVAAVDDWALFEPDEALRDRLLAVARRADPGPWTDRLRDPAVWRDRAALERLAADADPAARAPAALSALVELMQRHYLDGRELLAAARTRHPTDFELAFALGQRHTARGDGRAVALYEAARALRPDNATVWNNLATAHARLGEADLAVAAFREAARLGPGDADARNNLGILLSSRGDRDGALAEFREAVRIGPGYARAYNGLGIVLREKGLLDEAIAAYRECVRLDPTIAIAHYNLGNALLDKKDLDGAAAAYREALRLDPGLAVAANNLAATLGESGDAKGAVEAAREAVRRGPADPKAHFNLGFALERTGDVGGAIDAYRDAIRRGIEGPGAHFKLGNALAARGEFEAAAAALREAVRRAPDLADAHSNLGAVLSAQGNSKEAVAACREGARLAPANTRARFSLGLALQTAGDADGAVAEYAEAVRLDPGNAWAHINLGVLLLKRKEYAKALASARAAVGAAPQMDGAHVLLADVLLQTGDLSGARAALTEAARLNKRWALKLAFLPAPVAPPPHEVRP